MSNIESNKQIHNINSHSENTKFFEKDLFKNSDNWFKELENTNKIPNEFLDDSNFLNQHKSINKSQINNDKFNKNCEYLESNITMNNMDQGYNIIQDDSSININSNITQKQLSKSQLLTKNKIPDLNKLVLPKVSNIIHNKSHSVAMKYTTDLSTLYTNIISMSKKINPKTVEGVLLKRKKYTKKSPTRISQK